MYDTRTLEGSLALTNAGGLTLFPLGTGSAFAKGLYQNNIIIIKGDTHLMVDCGTRAPEALFKLGTPITGIRSFLITHSHADHIGGLEEALLLGRYVTRTKPRMVLTPDYARTLWNHSLKGGAAPNERHDGKDLGLGDYAELLHPVKLRGFPRDTWRIDLDGLELHLFRTKHYPDSARSWEDSAFSLGMVIDGKILFTGDTRFDPDLVRDYCARFPIEHILHDVQFFPGGVHAPFEDLCTLEADIRAKTLLMHYPDTWANQAERVKAAGFDGFLKQQVYYDFS